MRIPEILIVGAGQVGSNIAKHVLSCNAAHVMLYDVRPGVAEGMAIDLSHCVFHVVQCSCAGTDKINEAFDGADLVVFSAGVPRYKDQKRIDLLLKNARIALNTAALSYEKAPSAPFLIITNPVDVLSTVVKRAFPRLRVIGMGCGLDTMRFRYYIASHLKLPVGTVQASIAGSHDDAMMPLWEAARVGSIPLNDLISDSDRGRILELTRSAGDRIVQSLGRGSSVAAGVLGAQMIHSYFSSDGAAYSADCFLEDCFGVKDCMISLPCILFPDRVHMVHTSLTDLQETHLTSVAQGISQHAEMVLNEVG